MFSVLACCQTFIRILTAVMLLATSSLLDGAEPAIAAYRWPNGTDNLDVFAGWLGRETVWGEDFIGSES